jgi:hypothetical protein
VADLATVDELRTFLKLPGLTTAQAELALGAVSARVRGYTRRAWEAVDGDEIRVAGTGTPLLLLPKLPVRDLTSIIEDPDGEATELAVTGASRLVEWDEDGLVRRIDGGIFVRRLRYYGVTVDHGEPWTEDVKLVGLRICARAVINPEGLTQETVQGYGSSFGFDLNRLAVLTAADKAELSDYRTTV